MAVDLRQVMAAVLTFSMFIMLGNMIKRDHIDPLLEPLPVSPDVQYHALKVSKPGMVKLTETRNGPWMENNDSMNPCWTTPLTKGKVQSNGYIFFSLTHGPEYHASQLANAVAVAKRLGAKLALPDIRGSKLGEKRRFGEIYDVDNFIRSLNGVVQVEKNPPAEISNGRLPIVRVPNRVSEDFIASKVEPVFKSRRNLKIVTYFNPSAVTKGNVDKSSNAYQCLAMFESLRLQTDLQELADSMVGTLRSMSQSSRGRFIAVDLRVEMLGKKSCRETDEMSKQCQNAEEIGLFLKKIGFQTDTTIYLTQTGWHSSLNALRDVFPTLLLRLLTHAIMKLCHQEAIIPADEKAKFMDSESHEYEKFIDFYMCTVGDVFVPAFRSRFYASIVGKRIADGNIQILLPAMNTTTSAADYISPYIAKKSHFAYSCFC
ncbi:UNVERIFIED_CONTAM: protein MANNAN SYNTHESIS-RELATED 1 [Sesamum angustifolium]|uniref:O-fucosyltransferase family protein n=1 Tax=Sesamum angustifolium TaxID=2727405 RepID=A0AAW2MPM2_9LAMI